MYKKALIIVFIIVIGWVVISYLRISIFSKRAAVGILNTQPFQRAGENGQKILVLGDSLAYGTGTSTPEKSIAGLVASRFPGATVINKAANGKRTQDQASEAAEIDGNYDLILIIIGGNDVLRPWIDLNKSAKNLETIYSKASKHSNNVIALTTGDLRYTTLFLWPANHYFSSRSVTLRNYAKNIAEKYTTVTYVDIVQRNKTTPFDHSKEASDHLHLNDDGAKYWFEAIKQTNKI